MMHLMHSRRLRRATSIIATAAMVLSMVVVPSFAAPTPTVPVLVSAGTTGIASIDGTGSAGLLGTYSLEMTGVPATRGFIQSNMQYMTAPSKLYTLGSLNVSSDPSAALKIKIQTSAVNTDTVVTGLTGASTITELVNAINAQFGAYVTASFDTADRIRIEADAVGASTVGVYDSYPATTTPVLILGQADAAFRGVAAPGDWNVTDGATAGTDYVGFGTTSGFGSDTATFTPFGGAAYKIDTEVGSINATSGAFEGIVSPATGYYTAIKMTTSGHEFTLKTAGSTSGLGLGKVTFDAINGVRDAEQSGVTVTQGVGATDWQAGKSEIITVTVTPSTTETPDPGQNALNGIKVTLPTGFSFDTTPNVTASVTSSYTIAGNVLTLFNFQANADGPDVDLSFKVKNATTANSDTGLPVYPLVVAIRNVGAATTAFTDVKTQNLNVYSENVVNSITADAPENDAGGYTKLEGKLWDKYGNEIIEWPHSVQFNVVASPSPTATLSPAEIATTTPASPFETNIHLSATDGVNTVRVSVDNTMTVYKDVSIDTAGILAPYKLVLTVVDGRLARAATDTPEFTLALVDQNGRRTSFPTADHTFRVKYVASDGGWDYADITIPDGYSTSDEFDFGSPGIGAQETWTFSAFDQYGYVNPADLVRIEFGAVMGAPYRLKITAADPVPGNYMEDDSIFGNYGDETQFGIAAGDGVDQVTFTAQVVDAFDRPIALPGIAVTFTPIFGEDGSDGWTWKRTPGALSSVTATTNAAGSVTVAISSTTGSREFWLGLSGWGWDYTYFTPVSFETTLAASNGVYDYGFAYFYRGRLMDLESDKDYILADGVDKATITATIEDQAFGMPVAGWPIEFQTSAGSLSATSGVSDANGEVTAFLTTTSTEDDDANIRAFDKDGNTASVDVGFSTLTIRVEPVATNAQGGYSAYQDVRLSFWHLDGTQAYFEAPTSMSHDWFYDGDLERYFYRDYFYSSDVDENVLVIDRYVAQRPDESYISYSWNPYPLFHDDYESGIETASVDGKTMGKSATYRFYASNSWTDDYQGIGAANLLFSNATLVRASGVFLQEEHTSSSGSTDVSFVNNATFSVSTDKATGTDVLNGSGFFVDDELWGRTTHVYLFKPGDTGFQDIGDVQLDPQGTVYGGYVNVPTFLDPGSYDITVDDIVFPNALTVTLSPTNASIVGLPSIMKVGTGFINVAISPDIDQVRLWIDNTPVGAWEWGWNGQSGGTIFPVDWSQFAVSGYPGTEHTVKVEYWGYTHSTTTQAVKVYSGAVPTALTIAAPSTARPNVNFSVATEISPPVQAYVNIWCYKKVTGRGWVRLKTVNVRTGADGKVTFNMSLPSAGLWAIRTHFGGSAYYKASNSSFDYVTVR